MQIIKKNLSLIELQYIEKVSQKRLVFMNVNIVLTLNYILLKESIVLYNNLSLIISLIPTGTMTESSKTEGISKV